MNFRNETEKDIPAVHKLNEAAFGSSTEATLVDALRKQAQPFISLVAEEDGVILGHILFTPVSLSGHPELRVMGLAPMAVMPGRQRQGIGSALVRAGLAQCRVLGFGAVVVLGHPTYYPRFGFVPASRFGMRCEFEAPDEAFMALALQPDVLHGKNGTIHYLAAFHSV